MRSRYTWVMLVVPLSSVSACTTHGQVQVVAPSARTPVSFSEGLLDELGYVEPSRIHKVGDFEFEGHGCDGEKVDLSHAINEQVSRAKGDAIIDLMLLSNEDGECFDLRVVGVIVTVAPPPARAASSPAEEAE